MRPLAYTTLVALTVALLTACVFTIWIMAVPEKVSYSAFAVSSALLIAIAAIALNTYRNGQATGSLGQLLHETDAAPRRRPR